MTSSTLAKITQDGDIKKTSGNKVSEHRSDGEHTEKLPASKEINGTKAGTKLHATKTNNDEVIKKSIFIMDVNDKAKITDQDARDGESPKESSQSTGTKGTKDATGTKTLRSGRTLAGYGGSARGGKKGKNQEMGFNGVYGNDHQPGKNSDIARSHYWKMGVNEEESNINLDKGEKDRNIARVNLEKRKATEKKKNEDKAKHTKDPTLSKLKEEVGPTVVKNKKETEAEVKKQVRQMEEEKKKTDGKVKTNTTEDEKDSPTLARKREDIVANEKGKVTDSQTVFNNGIGKDDEKEKKILEKSKQIKRVNMNTDTTESRTNMVRIEVNAKGRRRKRQKSRGDDRRINRAT